MGFYKNMTLIMKRHLLQWPRWLLSILVLLLLRLVNGHYFRWMLRMCFLMVSSLKSFTCSLLLGFLFLLAMFISLHRAIYDLKKAPVLDLSGSASLSYLQALQRVLRIMPYSIVNHLKALFFFYSMLMTWSLLKVMQLLLLLQKSISKISSR